MTELNLARPWLDKTIEEGAQNVTVACVSPVTGEEGGMVVTAATTVDDVLKRYSESFPREAAAFLTHVKRLTSELQNTSGMSGEGRMMQVAAIPEFVMWAMRAKKRDYWDTKERIYKFIRSYPAFMVGHHSSKKGIK